MSLATFWLGVVGIVLAVLAVVGWIWSESVIPPAVFTTQAGVCLVAEVILIRRRPSEHARFLPDFSYGTVVLGVGAAMILNGLAFGLWLLLIGAGVAALGLAQLAREVAAARRSAR